MRASWLAILLFLPWPFLPVTAFQPPAGQDWVVSEDTLVSDETIIMDFNLTVMSGATLELQNVSLDFNTTYNPKIGIKVESGASLVFDNCYLNTLYPTRPESFFIVNGRFEAKNSTLARLKEPGAVWGLSVRGGYLSLSDCVLREDLYCTDGGVLAGDTIFNLSGSKSSNDALSAENSKMEIQGCDFGSVALGIYAEYCDLTVRDCYFAPGTQIGVSTLFCNETIAGCGFGALPYPGAGDPCPVPGMNYTIRNCSFEDCLYGCSLTLGGQGSGSENYRAGVWTSHPEKSIIRDCRFFGQYNGIRAFGDSAVVERSAFVHDQSATPGINCYGGRIDSGVLRNNTFSGCNIEGSAFTVEGNLLDLSNSSCANAVLFRDGSAVRRNIITGRLDRNVTGIFGFAGFDTSEISGNTMSDVKEGIVYNDWYGSARLSDNIIRAGTGIRFCSQGEIGGNEIQGDRFGILYDPLYYSGDLDIHDNIISAPRGIELNGSVSVRNNTISDVLPSGTGTGINVTRAPGSVRTGAGITGNRVSAATGIRLSDLTGERPGEVVENNTLSNCSTGITLERCNISVQNNRFENISRCGLELIDCPGEIGANEFPPGAGSHPEASRVERLWTLTVLTQVDYFNVHLEDRLGWTGDNSRSAWEPQVLVRDYRINASGTTLESNPYHIVVWANGSGAAGRVLTVDHTMSEQFNLLPLPDLVARDLYLSDPVPVEKNDVTISAKIQSDPAWNTEGQPVATVITEIRLDGGLLFARPHDAIVSGMTFWHTETWRASAGWHNLTLVVDPDNGVPELFEDNNRRTLELFVAPLPRGDLRIKSAEVELGTPFEAWVATDGDSSGFRFRFNFGDGTPTDWSDSPNASHVYNRTGVYEVTAEIMSDLGVVDECRNSVTVTVIRTPGTPVLGASSSKASSLDLITFNISILNGTLDIADIKWSFGDGGSYRSPTALGQMHAYARPGNYTVTVGLVTVEGYSYHLRMEVEILNRPPTAYGSAFPTTGNVTTEFRFKSLWSDQDGQVVAWNWDLGDGNLSQDPQPGHIYSSHGVYRVRFFVVDDLGASSPAMNFTITVENLPPIPVMGISRMVAGPGSVVRFDASGSSDMDDPPANLSFSWDFGDGAYASGAKASHAYPEEGRYTVTLTVSDGAGGVTKRTATVEVRQAVGLGVGWELPATVAGILLAVSIIIYILVRMLTHRHKGHGPPENGVGNGKPPKDG